MPLEFPRADTDWSTWRLAGELLWPKSRAALVEPCAAIANAHVRRPEHWQAERPPSLTEGGQPRNEGCQKLPERAWR